MNCDEFQKNIIPFINGTLSVKKMKEMLYHCEDCSSCRDELEIYYIILNGVRQLDTDEDVSDNFHERFVDFLKQSAAMVKKYYRRMVTHRIAFPMVTLFAISAAGLSVKRPDSATTVTPTSAAEFTDNDLVLRFRFSDQHRYYEQNITVDKILQITGNKDGDKK